MILYGVLFLMVSFVTAIFVLYYLGTVLLQHGFSEMLVWIALLECLTIVGLAICYVFIYLMGTNGPSNVWQF